MNVFGFAMLKIPRRAIRAYNGPRLIVHVTPVDIAHRGGPHGENVKRWTNVWRWRRCYSSKLSLHPPTLRAQSSSICLLVSHNPLSTATPQPFCWVTPDRTYVRIELIVGRSPTVSLPLFFFSLFLFFLSPLAEMCNSEYPGGKSSCRPRKVFRAFVLASGIFKTAEYRFSTLFIPLFACSVFFLCFCHLLCDHCTCILCVFAHAAAEKDSFLGFIALGGWWWEESVF